MTLRKEDSMKIRLIRHFATAGNLERRYIGRTDEPILAPAPGKQGSLGMSEYIVSSPMLRCRQTVEVLFGREPDAVCSLLCETDFGTFEGKNYEELKEDPDYQRWLDSNGTIAFPGGEGRAAFAERTCRGFEEMIGRLIGLGCQDAAFVVHGGTIMAVLSNYAKESGSFYDWQTANGTGFLAELDEAEWLSGKKRLTEIETL